MSMDIKSRLGKPLASCIRIRYIQMALLFFLMLYAYASRTILSVAIVAMVKSNTSSNADVPTFNWTHTGVILSSFYWSYAALQFFSGPISQTFSPKWILTIATIVDSASCLLIPTLAVYLQSSGVMVCRAIQGVAQGFILPSAYSMLGKWAPTEERSWISTTVNSGSSFGTILSMPVTAYLSTSSFGWPGSFYVFGTYGLVWCVFWVFLAADRPATHKKISQKEKRYIENSLGQEEEHIHKNEKVPWKAILCSLPYWAIITAAIGESWGSTFLITEIPTFLDTVTGIDIEKNSLYSSAPYLVSAVMTVLYGPLADYLIQAGITSRKTSRRIFHGIGTFIPAAALIWLTYEENRTAIAILLIVAISLNGAMFCGYNVNHIDISPRFSGVLFGISNGIGQTLAILAPMLVQFIVHDPTDKTLWRTMFIIASITYAATAAFFITFLSAERQWWDDVPKASRTDFDMKPRNSEEIEKL